MTSALNGAFRLIPVHWSRWSLAFRRRRACRGSPEAAPDPEESERRRRPRRRSKPRPVPGVRRRSRRSQRARRRPRPGRAPSRQRERQRIGRAAEPALAANSLPSGTCRADARVKFGEHAALDRRRAEGHGEPHDRRDADRRQEHDRRIGAWPSFAATEECRSRRRTTRASRSPRSTR